MTKLLCYMPTPGGLTGAPRRLLTLCRVLKYEGIDVYIASEPCSDLLVAAEEQGIETVPFEPRGVLGLRHGALFGGGLFFKLKVVLALIRQNLALARLVRKSGADVVWLRGSKSIGFAAKGAWLAQRPIVWDIDYELPSRGIVKWLHRIGLSLSCAIVYQYNGAGERIFGKKTAEKYGYKSHALIPGVELDRLKSYIKEAQSLEREQYEDTPFRILQVGTVCERKNQLLVIHALAELKNMGINKKILFQLAGGVFEEDYARRLEKDIEKTGLQENIEFLGWRDDINYLMSEADLLVLPSLDEGVPNAVQEAMYIGLPVMVSNAGGMPEIVEHGKTGWVLPFDDPVQWARQIAECIQDEEKCKSVGEAASRYAANYFSTDVWGKTYAEIVRQAAGRL